MAKKRVSKYTQTIEELKEKAMRIHGQSCKQARWMDKRVFLFKCFDEEKERDYPMLVEICYDDNGYYLGTVYLLNWNLTKKTKEEKLNENKRTN